MKPKAVVLWRSRRKIRIILALCASLASLSLLVCCKSGCKQKREGSLIKELEGDLAALRQQLQGEEPPRVGFEKGSRGIVICAGGNPLLVNTYVSVKVLRHTLQCTLPIQIFHHGQEEVGPKTRAAFKELGNVTFVDMSQLPFPKHHRPPSKFPGYAQKIYSLYRTSFEQVLLLDADSQPLINPETLFETDAFREHGNLLWSDFWAEGFDESPEEAVYGMLGLRAPWRDQDSWSCAETGQVLFNRARHSDVLEWLWLINSHNKLLYKHMLGDKDTFEMAFMLASKRNQYQRVLQGPGMVASSLQPCVLPRNFWYRNFGPREERTRYMRLGMLQMDIQGRPAFVHRTERTKFDSALGSNKMLRPAFVIPPFTAKFAAKVRDKAWRMHSVPASLATEAVTCDMVDDVTRGVLRQVWAHGPQKSAFASLASTLGAQDCQRQQQLHDSTLAAGGKKNTSSSWRLHDKSLVKAGATTNHAGLPDDVIPLIPVDLFGEDLSRVIDAAYAAFDHLHELLGKGFTSKRWSH